MSEELLAELAAMGRLIERLAHEIERLNRQFDRTEAAAQRITQWRRRSIMEEDGTAAELYPPTRRVELWPASGRDDDGSD